MLKSQKNLIARLSTTQRGVLGLAGWQSGAAWRSLHAISRALLVVPFTLLVAPLFAQSRDASPTAPPPVAQTLPRPASPGLQAMPQRVYGPTSDTLIARQAVDGILEGFRRIYANDDAPRVVIYVNRALVDPTLDRAATGRSDQVEPANPSTRTSAENSGNPADTPAMTLADQQTVREIERLFGRAFRHAGAQLADQKVAALLLPDQPGAHLLGDQAARDRAALSRIADIAIEVLISSRHIVVSEISGDATYPVPDIQATAIRLKDAVIVGQAAASDIIGKGVQAGRIIRQFDVSDITEATAIALMEDMLTGQEL